MDKIGQKKIRYLKEIHGRRCKIGSMDGQRGKLSEM
jgi:hypothetical protein